MWRTASLLVICGAAVANGLSTDHLPLWRQMLCAVLAAAGYLQGRHMPVPRAWPVFVAAAVAGASCAVYDVSEAEAALGVLAVFVALPWLAGRYRKQQAELIAAGRQRIADLERERAHVAERARLRERDRVAADLHDALGHELALIALRAGALELDTTLPGRPRTAAKALREAAVTATDRLRRTLSLLRADAPPAYTPAAESLEALITRARTAGMTVTLHTTLDDAPRELAGRGTATRNAGGPALVAVDGGGGFPSGGGPRGAPADGLVDGTGPASDGLAGPVRLAVHRVAQEALTNAARHAPGAPVTVRLDRGQDAVTLTVTNPLPAPAVTDAAADGDGTPPARGSGLPGLCERVRLLGGTMTAGPEAGAFTITARLPATKAPK